MAKKAPDKDERRRRPKGPRLIRAAGLLLACWALAQELRKPPAERTWHGTLAGVVPYDLRMPTVARVRERLWAPDDPRIVMPRVFGAGWTLNLGRITRLVRARLGTTPAADPTPAAPAPATRG